MSSPEQPTFSITHDSQCYDCPLKQKNSTNACPIRRVITDVGNNTAISVLTDAANKHGVNQLEDHNLTYQDLLCPKSKGGPGALRVIFSRPKKTP